jgi:hypothetical protein
VSFRFHPYFNLPELPRTDWELEIPAIRKLVLDSRGMRTMNERGYRCKNSESSCAGAKHSKPSGTRSDGAIGVLYQKVILEIPITILTVYSTDWSSWQDSVYVMERQLSKNNSVTRVGVIMDRINLFVLSLGFVLFGVLPSTAYAQPEVAWTYSLDDGAVQISNRSTTTEAVLSLDGYIGDQAACGTTLSCYYHASLVSRILLPPAPGGTQPGSAGIAYGALWENILSGAGDADYQSEYVYASTASDVTFFCTKGLNFYKTTEHNPGAAASSGDGEGAMWETHQGGSSGKNCDTFMIPSGTPTQIGKRQRRVVQSRWFALCQGRVGETGRS